MPHDGMHTLYRGGAGGKYTAGTQKMDENTWGRLKSYLVWLLVPKEEEEASGGRILLLKL